MHNNKNGGTHNSNVSPNQIINGNRGSEFKASPIRESLIKNTGAFILGNPNNNQGASGGSPSGAAIATGSATNSGAPS